MMNDSALSETASLRRYEYDDGVVFAGDLGRGSDAMVDVVDDTAIVAVDDDEYDLDLPSGDAQAFIHNGVLTIEVTTEGEVTEE